jgi:hypothetical protein
LGGFIKATTQKLFYGNPGLFIPRSIETTGCKVSGKVTPNILMLNGNPEKAAAVRFFVGRCKLQQQKRSAAEQGKLY